MREICFDTETTGLDPETGDRVIEIGCVEIIDGKKTGRTYQVYINPERDVPQESQDITGLTTEFLQDKPVFAEVVDEFLDFIGPDSVLVAHNSTFDTRFINWELKLLGREPLGNKIVDSLDLAKTRFPGQRNNLDALCRRFEIDSSMRDKHGALLDAELLTEVYMELTGGTQNTMFGSDSSAEAVDENLFQDLLKNLGKKEKREARHFKPMEAEVEAHNNFVINNIKNNLWGYIKKEDVV